MPADDDAPEIFTLWRGNETPARLFFASDTQWRFAGMSGTVTGLDYAGVRATADSLAIDMTPDVFRALQHMEAAAMDEMRKGRA
ncbi:MAG: DUF1799 domain-containing protein [Rhodospirillales bacterium]|nr:DUF1799 domain-containing protein [Rhodospirillales bacterium]